MRVRDLLMDLRERGVQFESDGLSLIVEAPTGVVDEETRCRLTEAKPEIVRLLAREQRRLRKAGGDGYVRRVVGGAGLDLGSRPRNRRVARPEGRRMPALDSRSCRLPPQGEAKGNPLSGVSSNPSDAAQHPARMPQTARDRSTSGKSSRPGPPEEDMSYPPVSPSHRHTSPTPANPSCKSTLPLPCLTSSGIAGRVQTKLFAGQEVAHVP